MPLYRETRQIFKSEHHGEVFENNWMDSPVVVYPETQEWDYKRELRPEEVEIWEVIKEWSDSAGEGMNGGFSGVYAAWRPHAELYMVKLPKARGGVCSFYGPTAEQECRKYLDAKGVHYFTYPKHYDAGIYIDRKGLHYKQPK